MATSARPGIADHTLTGICRSGGTVL